jgi:uncharacterized Zn-finger protein
MGDAEQPMGDEIEVDVEQPLGDAEHQEQHQCNECWKKFGGKHRLADHMSNVHSERKYCSLCPESFSNKRNLNRHVREIHRRHDEDQYCTNCGKVM